MAPAAEPPQLLEQERRGDDGRAGVEGEAVLAVDVGAAAGRVELFQHGDAIAAGAEPDRRRQAAEAAADDDRRRLAPPAARWPRIAECQHNLTL